MASPARRALGWIGVTVVIAVAAALLLRHSGSDPLARVMPDRRVTEARLSTFEYAPLRVPRSDRKATPARPAAALAELESALQRERTPRNLHRFGAALLAVGKTRDAETLLLQALHASPGDAALLTDVSAAEMTLGRIADSAEYAARALAIDPVHAPSAFNWALALERLFNRPAAIEAWQRYLQLDSDSGWAAEARRHLAELTVARPTYATERHLLIGGTDRATIERLVHRYPQRARARAQNVILVLWVEHGRAADLEALRTIGATRAGSDPYILDMADHAATHRPQMIAAMREYGAARTHEQAGRWDEAAAGFAEAAALLRAAGSPLAWGASIYAASSELSAGRADAALARLEEVERGLTSNGDRYPAIAAEAAWARGLLLARRGESDAALDAYRVAQDAARRAGEVEHEAAIAELVASRMAASAEPEEADRLRLDVLRRFDELDVEPLRMLVAFQEMAFTSLRAGRPHVALAFARVASSMAADSGDVAGVALSTARRAMALQKIGRREAALLVLADARAQAMRIPSQGARDRALAELDYTTGAIELPQHPDRARQAFSSALSIWDRYGWRNHIAAGLLARGEAALAGGDVRGAEEDFRAGVAQMEGDRARISEPLLRIAFFERSDQLFDRLTALLLDTGRTEDALSVVERKRARFLLDRIAGEAVATPLDAPAMARRTPEGTAILEIALLDRGAELWAIRKGRIAHGRSTASRIAIEETTARHVAAAQEGDEATMRGTGRWLYDQLLAPIDQHIGSDESLVVVADGALHSLPFTTLVTPSGQYLVARPQPVLGAPSASVFLRTPSSAARDTLLAVAQPSPSGFVPLPDAGREAAHIASSHPRGRLVRGEAITPEEFLEVAASAGTVHYAGHALADEERPFRSSLVFESARGAVHLTAETIGRSRLAGHPFVVLAACSTGRGKTRRNEGVDSLAAAFLQAGARGVAATLWDIDDAPSSRLFRTFHDHLRQGATPADALRRTQLAFLHSDDPADRDPAVWGSITLIAAN